jgi:septum formation inhibitor-activating ATPase MinD
LDQIQHTLNQPVLHAIPASAAALEAVTRGRPVVAGGTSTPDLERALRAFAEKAVGAKAALGKTA